MPSEGLYKEGAVIYFENDPSTQIFILRTGHVELTREVFGGGARQLGPGEILGLADTLGGQSRIGSARAISNVSATVLTIDELRGLLTSNIAIGLKVITSLCSELREIDEVIVKRMRGGLAQSLGKNVGLRMIADHFRRKGLTRAARYAYGRYLETDPAGEERLEAALHLAGLCEKDGEIEVAVQIYGQLVEEFPDDPRPHAAYNRLKSIMETFKGKL